MLMHASTLRKARAALQVAIDHKATTEERLDALAYVSTSDVGVHTRVIRTPTAQYIMSVAMFRVLCVVKTVRGITEAKETMAEWFDMDIDDAAIMEDDKAFPPWRRRRKDVGPK